MSTRPQRLGLFGGRFDPPHLGHLLAAEQAAERLALDQVWFLPSARPPHKPAVAAPAHRYAMTLLATADNPRFRASALELERPGPSYTIDTVLTVAQLEPQADLYYLVGTDAYADIASWHRAAELIERVQMVGLPRPGSDPAKLLAGLEPRFRKRLELLELRLCAVSATELRRRLAAGQSTRYWLPEPVLAYALKHGLYRPDPTAPASE